MYYVMLIKFEDQTKRFGIQSDAPVGLLFMSFGRLGHQDSAGNRVHSADCAVVRLPVTRAMPEQEGPEA